MRRPHERIPFPYAILGIVAVYFAVLVLVSFLTSRKDSDNADFFLAGRKSPWPLVAIGMVGSSLSGVTFISIPGAVGGGGVNQAFSYMQVVLGYLLGYLVIALVLLPLYYRMGLTSIYEYLRSRIGLHGYKIGAFYFLLSRTIGSSFRLFLVAVGATAVRGYPHRYSVLGDGGGDHLTHLVVYLPRGHQDDHRHRHLTDGCVCCWRPA